MIDLTSIFLTRDKGLETILGTYGIEVVNDLPKLFLKKAFFTQRLGICGKNRTKLSYPKID